MSKNIIVANIGWNASYVGGGISSHHTFVREQGTGAEAYNFTSHNGLFYGYVRGGSGLDRFSDRLWTVAFVSKPSESERLRLVGWYERAQVGDYQIRPEYSSEPDFPRISTEERYCYNATARTVYLVPEDARRDFQLPSDHRLKSAGIYYVSGGDGEDTKIQAAARAQMADWLRESMATLRPHCLIEQGDNAVFPPMPGVKIDEGGHSYGYSPVAETEEHRRLREWICDNPEFATGDATVPSGKTEFTLDSADRIDAAFIGGGRFWAVEVKSRHSPPSDHYRGIFQCIKYRAVAEAMPGIAADTFDAVLVTENPLTPEHAALAESLGIRHLLAPMDR